MNKQDLIAAYKTFYQTANPDNDFLTALKEYDLSDYTAAMDELSAFQPYACGKVLKLRTNGSTTGVIQEYKLGPIALIPQIESALQTNGKEYSVWINAYAEPHTPDLINASLLIHDITFNLKLQFHNTNLTSLVNHLKTVDRPIRFACKPFSMLYLAQCPEFLNLVERFKVTSISTSDWEPLFKKNELKKRGVHINDHMIDWYTGLNFYHCTHNHVHFLPTFAFKDNKIRSLINLTTIKWRDSDDTITLGNVIPCSCGKNRMEFSIIPHHIHQISNYFHMKNAIYQTLEELTDPYINLQFVEQNNAMNILYTLASKKEINPVDRQKLTSIFHQPVVFFKDKFIMRGTSKLVPFTKNIDNLLNYTYQPKYVQFL